MDNYLVIGLSVYFCFDIVSSQTSTACPTGWVTHGNRCYHFSHDTETWADAMIMCRLDGGTLAEIDDVAENSYLEAKTKLLGGRFWVGGTDRAEENVWVWSTSKIPVAAGVSHWGRGQPDNAHSDENCLEINYGGYWNDRPCHTFQKYICEMMSGAPQEIVG